MKIDLVLNPFPVTAVVSAAVGFAVPAADVQL